MADNSTRPELDAMGAIGFNGRNNDTVGFVYGPNTRGTMDIVYGCLVVLITAIWTVVHINIPAAGETWWWVLFRRFRWGCVSIFAPDFLTLLAASQWDAATKSVARMRQLPEVEADGERWRLEHAFYANSGGFLLQCPDCAAFPVNAASVHLLVSKGYVDLPDMTADEIKDKSKADSFAKFAAIFQGFWLIAQTIARLAQGLPLSQLELFTLAFVVSTAMSYYFWWRKPQNVSTPTVIPCPFPVAKIRADAGLAHEDWTSTPMDFVEREGRRWRRRDMFQNFDLEAACAPRRAENTTPQGGRTTEEENKLEGEVGERGGISKCMGSEADVSPVSLSNAFEKEKVGYNRVDSNLTLVCTPTIPTRRPSKQAPPRVGNSTDEEEHTPTQRQPVQRVPDDATLPPARISPKIILSLILPSMLHSTIHLLGWDLEYPTEIERQLWRAAAVTLTAASCVSIATTRLLALVGYRGRYNLVYFWVNVDYDEPEGDQRGGLRRLAKSFPLIEVLLWLSTAGLITARLYIILEVVISLRAMPRDIFVTVNWIDFLPHV
ncbi:hypothetical protein DHEL01_v206492 [Diaporthe helianthi]|uniref:Uncharacterized protein n=1 Tax=Diaporthe helianthi TaxID=158607 RepID=A0A2P5HXZ6_DIAHE|nr:hypothetical protein DHEL01_v206492 [Diaporthe helianthi]